jgi:UDP-N-acetylmuramate dehydrogenase
MIFDNAMSVASDRFRVIKLADFTTWRIGGYTASVSVKTEEELAETLSLLRKRSVPWVILGKGSNTLAPSEGWHGVVVFLRGELAEFSFAENLLTAAGGAHLPSVSGAACTKGLSGLVFSVGIPGTVGGAIFMNAGAYGSSVSELVKRVKVLHPDGSIEYLRADSCDFGYRASLFQKSNTVVLGAVLELSWGTSSIELRRKAREVLQLRRRKFPLRTPNAGSVFRRPDGGPPPGKLIEDCRLKGYRTGGAMVSMVHANFIENTGNATSSDVMQLIEQVTSRVRSITGIELQCEIRQLGELI